VYPPLITWRYCAGNQNKDKITIHGTEFPKDAIYFCLGNISGFHDGSMNIIIALMMEAVSTFETSVYFYESTGRNVSEVRNASIIRAE
jgi:hypothetical protein